jgi:long-chain acyl-CoA synthetase
MPNLYTLFEENFVKNYKDTFLFFEGEEFSWGNIGKKVDFLCLKLESLRIKPFEKVGIFMTNCPEYIVTLLSIWKMGCIAVPINTYLKQLELSSIIEDAGISILFVTQNLLKTVDGSRNLSRTLRKIIVLGKNNSEDTLYEPFPDEREKIGKNFKESSCFKNDSNATALIIYTSGTTGKPKGVELTHDNLISNLESLCQYIKVERDDYFLLFLPMFHSFTLTTLIMLPIYCSSRLVVLPMLLPEKIVKCVVKYPVTIFIGIPALYKIMVDEKYNIPPNVFEKIKYFISGSAPLPVPILEQFQKKFNVNILEGYGLSETSPVVSLNPPDKVKFGSIGRPIPGVSVKIASEDGEHIGVGEIGELIVKGNNVMKGYYNNPDETETAFSNFWFKSGDLGYIDDDGYIYIVGRKKEMIIVAGINVYPQEIENVLFQHPLVEEAAVVGIPDSAKGELPKAFIRLKENMRASDDELKIYCRERLAGYKVPSKFEFVDDFPRNATGKILKRALI